MILINFPPKKEEACQVRRSHVSMHYNNHRYESKQTFLRTRKLCEYKKGRLIKHRRCRSCWFINSKRYRFIAQAATPENMLSETAHHESFNRMERKNDVVQMFRAQRNLMKSCTFLTQAFQNCYAKYFFNWCTTVFVEFYRLLHASEWVGFSTRTDKSS